MVRLHLQVLAIAQLASTLRVVWSVIPNAGACHCCNVLDTNAAGLSLALRYVTAAVLGAAVCVDMWG